MSEQAPEQHLQTFPSKQEVDEFVDAHWNEFIEDLGDLVSIRSVEDLDAKAPGAPWGPKCAEALQKACDISKRLGLETKNCDGYIGIADVPGVDDKQIALIAHSDVVPEGAGWNTDPFTLTRKDGYLLGRGVLDDKEGVLIDLWTAAFYQQREGELRHPLRILIGANEETSMGDLEYYLQHYDQPAFLMTPDSEFPATHGEKGQGTISVTSAPIGDGACIVSMHVGSASNAIPGMADVTVRADADKLPDADHIEIESAGKGLAKISATGVGGHASIPEGTVNALYLLVNYMLANGLGNKEETEFLKFSQQLNSATDGSQIGIAKVDDAFGPVTCVSDTMDLRDGRLNTTIDVRFVRGMSIGQIESKLQEIVHDIKADVKVLRTMPPFYVDADKPEVVAALKAYSEYTGKTGKAFTIGGGTYARHFKNAIGFGPEEQHDDTPDWVGPMHGPNEGMREDEIKRDLKIYIRAISNLQDVDL